jgi:hypothetical protein
MFWFDSCRSLSRLSNLGYIEGRRDSLSIGFMKAAEMDVATDT